MAIRHRDGYPRLVLRLAGWSSAGEPRESRKRRSGWAQALGGVAAREEGPGRPGGAASAGHAPSAASKYSRSSTGSKLTSVPSTAAEKPAMPNSEGDPGQVWLRVYRWNFLRLA